MMHLESVSFYSHCWCPDCWYLSIVCSDTSSRNDNFLKQLVVAIMIIVYLITATNIFIYCYKYFIYVAKTHISNHIESLRGSSRSGEGSAVAAVSFRCHVAMSRHWLMFDFVKILWPLLLPLHCVCLLKRCLSAATTYNYCNKMKTTTAAVKYVTEYGEVTLLLQESLHGDSDFTVQWSGEIMISSWQRENR